MEEEKGGRYLQCPRRPPRRCTSFLFAPTEHHLNKELMSGENEGEGRGEKERWRRMRERRRGTINKNSGVGIEGEDRFASHCQ